MTDEKQKETDDNDWFMKNAPDIMNDRCWRTFPVPQLDGQSYSGRCTIEACMPKRSPLGNSCRAHWQHFLFEALSYLLLCSCEAHGATARQHARVLSIY